MIDMTEIEQQIHTEIDALQNEIKERKSAIFSLLAKLPCEYIITRTFVKDWKCNTSSISKGYKQYYMGSIAYSDLIKTAFRYKSLNEAKYVLSMYCIPIEKLRDYVELKIERVEK